MLELEPLARRCQQEEQRPASLFVRRPGDEHRRSHCPDQVRQGEWRSGGLHACPLEGERHLSDPYFYPIYQTAADLDLAIAIHIANGNPENCDLYRLAPAGRFAQFRVPTVTACFNLLMSELPQQFPKLRWGFIEASAQWVPWVYREVAIRYAVSGRTFPKNIFEEYNVYVTCQTNDDVQPTS